MVIRKVTIGNDYKNGMNYHVGQSVLNDSHKINCIRYEGADLLIYIENADRRIMAWKSYNPSVPKSIEFNINY